MAFPTTSLLDDFNRANTGPPLSANWTADQMNVAVAGHAVVSNAATNGVHSYWDVETFGPDQEAWFTISTLASSIVGLHMRIQSPNTAGADSYEVVWRSDGTIEVVRVIDAYGTETVIDSVASTVPANGYKFGAEVLGTGATVTINVYIDTGSGWTLALSASDTGGTRITASGYIGFLTGSTSDVIDNFGGGTVVVPPPDVFVAWLRA